MVAVGLLAACTGGRDRQGDRQRDRQDDRSRSQATGETEPPVAATIPERTDIIDAHVHLTTGATDDLLAVLDASGVERAVILASPHLDPLIGSNRAPAGSSQEPGQRGTGAGAAVPGRGPASIAVDDIAPAAGALGDYRTANELILSAARAHPERLIPFITVDLGATELAYVRALIDRGACGVKIYQGHAALHARSLVHDSHRPLLAMLEELRVPVLLHVNTVHFRDELDRLMRAYPALNMVCAHFCSSRTDIDRLAEILAAYPALMVDTSHGSSIHSAAGMASIERERDRLIAMITAEPSRFLFGSDVVTAPARPGHRGEQQQQIMANLGLLAAESFQGWRPHSGGSSAYLSDVRGLALPAPVLAHILSGNARRWLAGCASRSPSHGRARSPGR